MKGKSDSIKRVRKFFSIAEFEKEEKYLTDMAAQGWRFVDTNGSIYTFERCEPEQVVYRLDFSGIPVGSADSRLSTAVIKPCSVLVQWAEGTRYSVM